MINKGKGCISAIFDGSIPIGIVKHGLDTVFQKPSEPVEPESGYISSGLIAHFSGEDDYTDGAWVDRVSGYKFTPLSTSTAPIYDATNKLYDQNTFGGMVSDFETASDGICTLEVVTRDVKNVTRNGTKYGTIVGASMIGYDNGDGLVIVKNTSNNISLQCYKNKQSSYHTINNSEFVANALDTLTIVPNVGFFRNGVNLAKSSFIPGSSKIGLFTHAVGSYASSYRVKGKIHAIRYYNRHLTDEEIAQNHAEDVRIYGV